MEGHLPERAVHVVNVHFRKLAGEFCRCERLEFVEELIWRLILATVARRINEEPEWLVPETTGDLCVPEFSRAIHKRGLNQHHVTGTAYLEIAEQEGVIVDCIRVNVAQNNTNYGKTILSPLALDT